MEEMIIPVDHKTVFISAHQGNCGIPSLPMAESYRHAIDLKVDYVEFDVRKTKDDIYVIWHDEDTPSKGRVCNLSYEEYRSELGDQALTVSELLTMARGRVGLHLDLKETGYENEIVKLALNSLTTNELVITSLEDASVRVIKESFPSKDFPLLKVGLSLGRNPRDVSIFKQFRVRQGEFFPVRRIRESYADFVAVHYLLATLTVLRYCGREHIPAWVWTVDNRRHMKRFLNDPRVTTLITNKPAVAMSLRATKVSSLQ